MLNIDRKSCTNCGECIEACLAGLLIYENENVMFDEFANEFCIECGHCMARCQQRAIEFSNDTNLLGNTKSFDNSESDIKKFLMGKRSVRKYKKNLVEKELIEEGICISQFAPCSKNGHKVKWVVVSGKDKIDEISTMIKDYFKSEEKYPEVDYIGQRGKNIVTLDAPHMIFTYADDDAFQPGADCVIAMITADMYWYKQGLGSCWSAYAMDAAGNDKKLLEYLGIPANKVVYGAMALGYPDEKPYPYLSLRKRPDISWK